MWRATNPVTELAEVFSKSPALIDKFHASTSRILAPCWLIREI
jgi:hypothetical protein